MLGGDALVAEVAVDLEHALEPSDHQPLEIELRRNPQVEVRVQRVVVGHERPGDRSARNRVHHRSFDFQEAAVDEEPADVVDGARARAEHLAAALVDDEVDVAAPIAGLDVGEPVVLLRQRQQRLHEQPDRPRLHRQLVGPGAEHLAFHRDDVPDVEPPELRVLALRQVVATQVDLNVSGNVAQVRERRLAHDSAGHHPSGDGHRHRLALQRLRVGAGEPFVQITGPRIGPEVVRIRLAALAQRRELRAALRRLVGDVLAHRPALHGVATRFGSGRLPGCRAAPR